MGCDIHGIIEQRKPGGEWHEHPVSIDLARDYELFGNLSGVRNRCGANPVAAKRGIPNDACYFTHVANCVWVGPAGVRPETAEKWIASGASTRHQEPTLVTNPDYHSHSWCTTDELERVLKSCEYPTDHSFTRLIEDYCYTHLLATMRLTESMGYEVRFVFWFDN